MNSKSKLSGKTYLNIFILCLSAYIVYVLPYLRWTYYDAVMEASGLNNTQFGLTMSLFGAVSMICYAPGGWIADRFSAKKLMSLSLVVSGLAGLWFSTFPGYAGQILIYILWGVCCTLTFWSAFQKATRAQGSSDEQGRVFGLVEGGRGIVATIVSLGTLYLFSKLGEGLGGLRGIVIAMAVICFIAAALVWFFLEDTARVQIEEKKAKVSGADIATILKTPAVWLIALVIICCYSIYLGSTYLTPYFTNIVKISASMSAFISIARTYVLQFVAAPTGGILADRIHSITKVVIGCYVLIIAGMAAILVTPAAAVVVLILAMIVLCTAIFAMRGIYFATVDEANIPMRVMGTAVGIISVIGFLPDVFMSTLCGSLLDKYAGEAAGYRAIFLLMLGFAIVGLIVSILLLRCKKKAE